MDLCNTYFAVAQEADYSGPQDTGVYDVNGNVIAMARAAFVASLCIEGSGKLLDGRIVNFAGSCSYGPTCYTGGQSCYEVLDANRFPWGKGAANRPLTPFRSIATDPSVIPTGSCVYIPAFDGMAIPSAGGVGGFTHNGYFVADDTGGWIRGPHIDIFVGPNSMVSAMERLFPTSYNGGATGTCVTTFSASIVDCSTANISAGGSGLGTVGKAILVGLVFAGGAAGVVAWRNRKRH